MRDDLFKRTISIEVNGRKDDWLQNGTAVNEDARYNLSVIQV